MTILESPGGEAERNWRQDKLLTRNEIARLNTYEIRNLSIFYLNGIRSKS